MKILAKCLPSTECICQQLVAFVSIIMSGAISKSSIALYDLQSQTKIASKGPYIAYEKPLRSNFNSRDFNGLENVRFFYHKSAPWRRRGTKIGGNESYRPPGPF